MILKGYEAEAAAKGYEQEAEDPPSLDFKEVIQPTISLVGRPADLTETNRIGWEALTAGRWKSANLLAWITSYER